MIRSEFCQWSRTICQFMVLVGVGIFVFTRKIGENRRPSHRFGGKVMHNTCLSLEPSYIPVRIRRRVLERDKFRCVWCGEEEKKRVSYFIQKRAGGETSYYNLVTTCEVCNRKRHYDTPPEFISKLVLEKLDLFKEVVMRVKIIRSNGEEIVGEIEELPDPNTRAFYLKHPGNGMRELIFVEPGMRIKQLGGREKK